MTDPIERIRQILEQHGEPSRAHQIAEDIVAQLQLRRENVDNKMRYVSAWFDDELTKLEGAE